LTQKLFMQMCGAPGSGKSTVSKLLRRSISDTVVIDHDVLRSSLLESNVPFKQAADQAYQLQWKLAQDFIGQGFNIIVDSTCDLQMDLDQRLTLAKDYGYAFWYVECKIRDIDLLDHRLRSRRPMTSQRTSVYIVTDEDCRCLRNGLRIRAAPRNNVVVVDTTGNAQTVRDHILETMFCAKSACFDCLAVGGTSGPLTDLCNKTLAPADSEVETL
jgi:predicted kinase